MSKVIILGAGSSKDCGLPLDNEVFEYFHYYGGPPWYDFMNKIFPQFTIGVTKYPTFEVVLSLIESWIENRQTIGYYSPSDLGNIRRSLIESFLEIFKYICPWVDLRIANNDGLMPEADVMRENFEWYQNFFEQFINKNKDVTFISMNYDVLLDDVLFKMRRNFTYGFDIYDLDNQDKRCRESGVLLLKPHGSINLAQCSKPDYDLNILQAFKGGMAKNKNGYKLKVKIVDKISNENEQLKLKEKYASIFNCKTDKISSHFEGFKKYTADPGDFSGEIKSASCEVPKHLTNLLPLK